MRFILAVLVSSVVSGGAEEALSRGGHWWKGNLHTHSLWSDGDDFPEMIIGWYKQQGYHFLAISDHNILQTGDRWVLAAGGGPVSGLRTNVVSQQAVEKYLSRFGTNWVEQAEVGKRVFIRLKTLEQYRPLFEEQGHFLLLQSEEITDRFGRAPVHLIGSNLREFVPPQGGTSVVNVIQNNVDAVLRQRRRTGQPMIPHLAHPNFGWAVTAEDLMQVKDERFFEVYNGHNAVHNEGDASHASTDRMWDIVLTQRLTRYGEPLLFGVAVDDAHRYHKFTNNVANPGRGWVVVRAPQLTAAALIDALEAGDFYSSTGVELEDVTWHTNRLTIRIKPEPEVSYVTQFIGTRRGFDPASEPMKNKEGEPLPVTRIYSRDIGEVFAEREGTSPSYQVRGDEIYVRAKVVSSKPKANAVIQGERETAWVQPHLTPLGWQTYLRARDTAGRK